MKISKIFQKMLDILLAVWYNIDNKGGEKMKNKNKKLPIEIADLIIKALVAIAALITALKS